MEAKLYHQSKSALIMATKLVFSGNTIPTGLSRDGTTLESFFVYQSKTSPLCTAVGMVAHF